MRALFVIHYPVFGGPHNQALRLAAPLAARGWQLTVLLPDEPGNAGARLRAAGVDVVTTRLHRLRATPDPRAFARLALGYHADVRAIRQMIRARGIDLVMIGGLVNAQAALAARLERKPVVWQVVDSRSPALLRRLVMPVVWRMADVAMFDGQALVDLHGGRGRLDPPSFVYYPPVDTARFVPSPERRAATRRALGIPEDVPVVGTVANLNPQKGIEFYVRAAGIAWRAEPRLWFLIVGARYDTHAAYLARLDAEVSASGVPRERFVFAGDRPDVERCYPAMDVKAITSVKRSEGTTTTAMEAMACGVPVVATDVGAVREVVEDGVTGLVVPPEDPDALAAAVARLLVDGALRAGFSERGRRRAVERYDVEVCARTHVLAFEAAIASRDATAPHARGGPLAPADSTVLEEMLVCPACRGALEWGGREARCAVCSRPYPVIEGIPVMLLDARASEHDELDHHHGGHRHDGDSAATHKHRQASFFDRAEAAEFEITRPHGTPRLHGWLLAEKVRRSVSALHGILPGARVLTVCGGSGMDAEFLARMGARVVTSDISLGAATRVRERARRYGLPIVPIVADVERLPFRDRSVDVAYVHDGLHHLERPEIGLTEMSRVAGRAVSVTEPARAFATSIAVSLGIAAEREDAGNRVARLLPEEVVSVLRREGFRVLEACRYGMFYRHEPGWAARALSLPGAFALTRLAWRAANSVAGRLGNKLAVQAVRG